VWVTFDEASLDQIQSMCVALGVPNPHPREKLHATLMYSEYDAASADYEPLGPLTTPYQLKPVDLRVVLQKTGKLCLVLTLESERMQSRHEELKAYGMVHIFDSLLIHVTLSYDIGNAHAFKRHNPEAYITEIVAVAECAEPILEPRPREPANPV
jgi:hypothetical protein